MLVFPIVLGAATHEPLVSFEEGLGQVDVDDVLIMIEAIQIPLEGLLVHAVRAVDRITYVTGGPKLLANLLSLLDSPFIRRLLL